MAAEERSLAILLRALQGLTLKDFQEFKTKFWEAQVEGGWDIPKDSLEEAAHPGAFISCMGKNHGGDAAMDMAIGLLQELDQGDLAEELLEEMEKEHQRQYREHVAQEFLWYREVTSCPGENVSINSRYTPLSISWGPRSQRGGDHGAVTSSHGAANTSDGPTTITAETLLRPRGDGHTPQVVVLVGAPGMGKTMTVRKVMVEWVEGTYRRFDYVFCIDCKDIALTQEASVVDLVSRCCPHRRTLVGKILDGQKRILFIFDGFEALGFSLVEPKEELSSDPREVKPLETTLRSLLKKTVLPRSSLLITSRPVALQSLGRCLEGERCAEILGFPAARREEHFHRFFGDTNKANMALGFARGDEVLYSLCTIPIMSWSICTVLKQELTQKKTLVECPKTTTQMSMFYLSWLMRCRDRDNPQDLQKFLPNLCSLAAEGIWKHKVLFEEKEIKERGLDQPELLPLFLNEKIPKKGVDQGNFYSFTHLHLQELFAAMFYVLEDDEGAANDSGALLKDVNLLLESYGGSRKDLTLVVRFLFGLVSPKSMKSMEEMTGCRISPQARADVLRWLQGRLGGSSQPGQELKVSELDTFHWLFEMNEESSMQSTLGRCTDIDLKDIKLSLYDQLALSFCIRGWAGLGCVTLRGCSFQQEGPSQDLPRSGASGAGEHPQPELHSPIHLLCRALQHPGSSLEVLRLHWCQLSESCCAELGELLSQHPRLARLELGDGTLGDPGVRRLCQGLRQPRCQLRVLR
ncbi:NLRP3 protein, partial [Brachypteracias leptosomus]|nr:NLRP3 protein [Brachypteracias leptosomus]